MAGHEQKYLIWKHADVKRECDVQGLIGMSESYRLRKDAPLGEAFTKAGACQLRNIDPKGLVLPDNLLNTARLLVVSPRLKDFLAARKLPDVEYLPVGLVDPEKRPLPGTLYIVHPLRAPDCLDVKKSGASFDDIDEEEIESLKALVFKADPARALFRIKGYADLHFVSRALAEAIHQAGFTGVMFYETENFLRGRPVVAFEGHDTLPAQATPRAAPAPKLQESPPEMERWLAGLGKGKKGQKFSAGKQRFIPCPGDREWLDAYQDSPDDWPAFDPERYHAIGFNGESDYWVWDRADGRVVYFDHELGYSEANFKTVATDWQVFSRKVSSL